MSLVPLPEDLPEFLSGYLPQKSHKKPYVTLTWAQSLDARISAGPGVQTHISHPETKTMTHYLRAHHDAILVGIGTVLADDPKLNCRYNGQKIRPVVLDPHARWKYADSTLHSLCKTNGLAPYIISNGDYSSRDMQALEEDGGRLLRVSKSRPSNWPEILDALHQVGISSVMVEGGAVVINDLLTSGLVDAVIITIGPVFLGKDGVAVTPLDTVSLTNVQWWTGTHDSVIAARIQQTYI